MKRFLLMLTVALTLSGAKVFAWDGRGHSAIAYIAERHLTPRAKANIEKYTGERSIVSYASWMDKNRHSKGYEMTHVWHVDYWTDDLRHDENGNPLPPASVSQVKRIIGEMPDFRILDDSTVNINIKYLVHLVGDMHCPVHVDFPKSRPMNVNVLGKKTRFHKLWDGGITAIKHNGMSPMMLAAELDTFDGQAIAAVQAGTPDDWYKGAVEAAEQTFALLPKEKNAVLTTENYFNDAITVVDTQLRNAGYRLAYVLNLIFDK